MLLKDILVLERLGVLLRLATVGVGALSCLSAASNAPCEAASLTPAKPGGGIDLGAMDRSVKPGNDFYLYANGHWQANAVIPDDKSQVGAYYSQRDTAYARIAQILKATSANRASKIGAFYASYMDAGRIEALGLTPVRPTIALILASPDKRTLARLMAGLQRDSVTGLIAPFVSADSRNPSVYAVYLEQDGLGLPDQHFYLDTDKDAVAGHDAYAAYAERLLVLAGQADAYRRAGAVIQFESGLAKAQWSDVKERDESKTYNRYAAADLERRAPGIDWSGYLTALGVSGEATVIVREPSAFITAANLWSQTPLPVLKDWLLIHYLDRNADYLSHPFQEAHFAFHGTAMSGTVKARPRAERAASLVANEMADGVGRAYVAAYFPPRAKIEIETIVANLKSAFRTRLATETWMGEATRKKAIEKLDAFQVVVGFPDQWRDDSGLEIRAGDLIGNVTRAERYTYDRYLRRLGTKVNRREFDHSAALPWAWATPTLNEIGFSAAFLQPPYFDPAADPAVNYGAIGAVIGHELSHHFDDQGSKHDAEGRLNDWWQPDDAKRFAARTQALVVQYSSYEPLPGLHINGALTLGENLADLAGLNISFRAYVISLNGKAAPVLAGFSGAQRFFLSHAQSYRSKQRDADLRNQVLSDPHPPEKERSDEVRNIDAWYDAFDIAPTDAMYLAPEQRVRVW